MRRRPPELLPIPNGRCVHQPRAGLPPGLLFLMLEGHMNSSQIEVERDNLGRFRRWKKQPLADRFWSKVERGDGCWLWRGAIDGNGYGGIKIAGKMYRCSRVAYELTNGPIPAGLIVLHSCDNRACVNPAHLRSGTHKDNTRDMIERKRNSKCDHRRGQLLGAAAKRRRTLATILPSVLREIQDIIRRGDRPLLRCCLSIPGYSTILGRYYKHKDIVRLAKGGSPSEPCR